MKRLISLCFLCLILVFSSQEAFGEWQGPVDVIVGEWGRGGTQFGFESGDMQDGFPFHFDISTQGMILIADIINGRIKLYNSTGMLLKIIVPPVEDPRMWILKPVFLRSKIILPINKLYFFSFDGKIDKVSDYPKSLERINNWQVNDDKLYLEQANPYTCGVLSSESQLLKTYTEKPLELGMVKEQSFGGGKYKTTIEYPDYKYEVIVNDAIERYYRDSFGNLFAIEKRVEGPRQDAIFVHKVYRFDRCNNEETVYDMLKSEYEPWNKITASMPAPRRGIIIEYGEPSVSPLGDLYCWARTKTEYKILKWTWQGPPDAPQSLRAASSSTGIALTWEQPQKNVGDVTDYEINRSGNVCGPFRPINTVKKDVLTYEDRDLKKGETYYYQVRAIRGKKYSGNSNKVVGKLE